MKYVWKPGLLSLVGYGGFYWGFMCGGMSPEMIDYAFPLRKLTRARTAACGADWALARLEGGRSIDRREALDLLVTLEPDDRHRQRVIQSLMALSRDKGIRDLLGNPYASMRLEACSILGEIGTDKSIGPLKTLYRDRERPVQDAARFAVQAIGSRARPSPAGGPAPAGRP